MGYIKATDVLPDELLLEIQKYVDGQLIYIPRCSKKKKKWGDNTDTKGVLRIRNQAIYQDWINGMSIVSLAEKYFLTEKSIQRILRNIKE
ncbi:CD3324 family protein [Fusibacillus kribbianus]|uniref:CD3324 family protein n=1 Tax=Fusibacillus kribbianus TaxID=3044208 RepID=A0AAP4BA98_9FIRM|nr:CD3324 family protein [Ruminococcus sp. YH-rum2234]MDI9242117.1 CD3324 family protein [Ruminococcus sp. YH-rum2234]